MWGRGQRPGATSNPGGAGGPGGLAVHTELHSRIRYAGAVSPAQTLASVEHGSVLVAEAFRREVGPRGLPIADRRRTAAWKSPPARSADALVRPSDSAEARGRFLQGPYGERHSSRSTLGPNPKRLFRFQFPSSRRSSTRRCCSST